MRELLFGFVAGGLVAGVLAWRKGKALEARGAAATQAFQGQGTALEALLTTQGATLQRDLQHAGEVYAPVAAERVAREFLSDHYGLTPERIAALSRLGARLGG